MLASVLAGAIHERTHNRSSSKEAFHVKWVHDKAFFFPALPGEYETLSVNYWNFDEKES